MKPIPIDPDEIETLTDALGLVRLHKNVTPAFVALFDKLAGAPVFPGYALIGPGSSLADLSPFIEGVECTDCGCPANELPQEGCTSAGCPLMLALRTPGAPDPASPDLLDLLRQLDRYLKGSQEWEHGLIFGTSQGVNGPTPADLVRAVLAGQPTPPLNPPGFLAIGANDAGQVVLNLPRDMTGHFVFSPSEAEETARILIKQAANARGHVGCAACDRGDFTIGHAEDCPTRQRPPAAAKGGKNNPDRLRRDVTLLKTALQERAQAWKDSGGADRALCELVGEAIGEIGGHLTPVAGAILFLLDRVNELQAADDRLQGEINGVSNTLGAMNNGGL